MNKKQAELGSWLFPIILYFIFPSVGTYFIIIKIVFTVVKSLNKKFSANNKSSLNSGNSLYNDTTPHDIDFSHDHNYNDAPMKASRYNNTKTATFETEVNVRCPICNANNFINKLPSECEYCGSKIVKI